MSSQRIPYTVVSMYGWSVQLIIFLLVFHSIKMEVGIEDCLHIEFEYNKSKYVHCSHKSVQRFL